jgi:hypothetical protein
MAVRIQVWILSFFLVCVGIVRAQVPSTRQFKLYHQLVHASSVDVTPRGIITYDPVRNTAEYESRSEVVDLTTGEGLYRVGLYDDKKKQLGPAAFAKLVSYTV